MIHDFTDAFDIDEYIYIDSCHVNGRGNQIIAKSTYGYRMIAECLAHLLKGNDVLPARLVVLS